MGRMKTSFSVFHFFPPHLIDHFVEILQGPWRNKTTFADAVFHRKPKEALVLRRISSNVKDSSPIWRRMYY